MGQKGMQRVGPVGASPGRQERRQRRACDPWPGSRNSAEIAGCKLIWSMAKRRRDIVQDEAGELERSRLDRWLWVARFFKTRALAAAAIAGGKVLVNGERPKRARPIQVGDQVRIRLGPHEHHVAVLGIAARRGPAAEASLLYQETPESLARRNEAAARLKAEAAAFPHQDGRPTKRNRREIAQLRGRR